MRRAIFISAGLGDSLLTLPLAKRLRECSRRLVGIVTTKLLPRSVLQSTGYFDRLVFLSEHKRSTRFDWDFYRCVLRNRWSFDEIVVPAFGAQKHNLRLMKYIRGRLITLSAAVRDRYPHRTIYVEPIVGIHDVVQNLRLASASNTSEALLPNLVELPSQVLQVARQGELPDALKRRGVFIAVQVSGIQDPFPQKSWPIDHWQQWFRFMSTQYPNLRWVLVGSQREAAAAQRVLDLGLPNVISTVGIGSLEATMSILSRAQMFVGLDGGLMHLAVGLGKPTFIIWGGSNPILYGYEQMDPRRHRDVSSKPFCGPCESWIAPNQTRTIIPRECPDFCCLHSLTPQMVVDAFASFHTSMGLS